MALLWHYFSVLPKIQNPWLPNRLSMVGGLCCTYDAVWAKLHTVIKQRKIIQKYISHKTEYSRCNYGSRILFMGHIWWMGNRYWTLPLRWLHNGNDGVSNHQPQDCLLNRLFRRRSKKTSKLRVTGLCAGNSQIFWQHRFFNMLEAKLKLIIPWWRHQMETFSTLLAFCAGNSPVTGEFPAQRPVTRSFDVFFDLCLNKRLSKQSWGWWFEMPSCPLWCHCNAELQQGHFLWNCCQMSAIKPH